MPVGIVYDDIYLKHEVGPHVEIPERLSVAKQLLEEKGIWDSSDFPVLKPRKATKDQLKYIHTESLITEIEKLCEKAEKTNSLKSVDNDTVVSGSSYEASLYSVGGNFTGIDNILDGKISSGFGLVRPPGHHSTRNKCAGFCLFNNIAVATEYLFQEKGLKKVAIFDCDIHHGNGTQDIFYDGSENGEVMFFSTHQDGRTLYPGSGFTNEIGRGKGEGYIVNMPMVPYSGDDIAQLLFDQVTGPLLNEFKPDFILISAGFDTHHSNALTGMGTVLNWTVQGPANLIKKIMQIADNYCQGKIFITLEGGYRLDEQAQGIYNVLKVLNKDTDLITEEEKISDNKIIEYTQDKLIKHIQETLSKYWNCF